LNWRRIAYLAVILLVVLGGTFSVTGYRTLRLYNNITDISSQVNYLIENGGTIGQAPADSTLSSTYLDIIFGDDPELLSQLKQAVEKGVKETPDVKDGEVAAIIVTYRKNGDDKIEHVAAHIAGGFPLGQRKITMHRDGYFASQIDENLWQTGDSSLKFLGRDLIVWANSEEDTRAQKEMIEAVFSGEIMLLASNITDKPLFYTAVLPAPRHLVPDKMKPHVRAILLNGSLSPDRGTFELIVLTDNERSAALVSTMMYDLRTSILIGLRTRFGGVQEDSPWGPHVPVWWAYEMANAVEDMQLTRRDRTVRLTSQYERRMVNVTLKTIERFGRDYTMIRGVQQDKLDPRVMDARMQSRKPNHYWSDAHRWGPDWPIGSSTNLLIQRPADEVEKLDAAPPVSSTL